MIRLGEIGKYLEKQSLSEEEFFKLEDLYKFIECSKEDIQVEECIITPFYIHGGKRYELYQYEFVLEAERGPDFKGYILKATGKTCMEDISADIIQIRQKCFARCRNRDNLHVLEELCDYIQFLFEDVSVREEVRKIFGVYNRAELYAIIY